MLKQEAIEMLKVQMLDGSIFEMPNKYWQKAFDLKYGSDDTKEIEIRFREITKAHFTNKTVPTKFGWDDPWAREYETHAKLGVDVMYIYIRSALMAVLMEEIAKEKGMKSAPRVIAIGERSTTEYTGHSKKKVKNLKELFGKNAETGKNKRAH